MNPDHPVWGVPDMRAALKNEDFGAVVRILRHAKGLTLAELGTLCGYSASRVSRYERAQAPLTDIHLLRRFAVALEISPAVFGILPPPLAPVSPNAPNSHGTVSPPTLGPNVGRDVQEDREDPVRRRELLTGAAGLTGAIALGLPEWATAAPTSDLQRILYGSIRDVEPVALDDLQRATAKARGWFQAARYDDLTAGLPSLLAAATATRDDASGAQRTRANALLADAYIAASALMVKKNDDQLAWATADRAVQAAAATDDPLSLADARRAVATVLRRTGHRARARDLIVTAAHEIEPGGSANQEQLSMYGALLQVAAYTAAVDGKRHAAHEYISEAKLTADRLGEDANHRFTAFGPAGVTVYQVSIAQVLGDNGTAIEHARLLRPGALPARERQGRLGIDVARAYHQWGKPEQCYRALRSVERIAPAEVRYRPPVHRMVEDLLRASQTLPGLRAFAERIGVPA